MRILAVQRIIGLLLIVFSATMIPPVIVGLIYQETSFTSFLFGFASCIAAGTLIWLPVRHKRQELRLRDGFLVVACFWIVLGLFGSLPLIWAEQPSMSITDAVFESISGLTTTGATVLTGLETLPKSILYYRQQLQWLGGMGIIVLAVAVLPMLGVGGMQLYRAETPGPVKDTKLTPRITETAKALWYIYLGLTILCAAFYVAAGLDWFDAIAHAFSTVSIGGFSTQDGSIGAFDNPWVEVVAIFFMFVAGINFSLHFLLWRFARVGNYLADPEFRAYFFWLFMLSIVVMFFLFSAGAYTDFSEGFRHGIFQTVSIATTTGFTTTSYASWPGAAPVLLLLASFVGGCAGSTGGGMKVIRWLLIYKQGAREIVRLVHPAAQIPVRFGEKAVPEKVVESVWGFFSIYVIVFAVTMILLLGTGLDQVTAFSAVAASLNNLGPGLGDVANNFSSLSNGAKWLCVMAMLLGRLEIFTILVLFTTAFWRR